MANANITKLNTDTSFFMNHLYHLTETYSIGEPLSDGIRSILVEAEKIYLPHSHVLCKQGADDNEKVCHIFRNVEEFSEALDEQMVKECNRYTLNRMNRSIDLYYDEDNGLWKISGLVESRWNELPFEKYDYYNYKGRIVRKDGVSYEIIDPETGDWEGRNSYYGCEEDYDCDRINFNSAHSLIEKEQKSAVERLLKNMDIAFERYGKSEDELLPDIRDRIKGTEFEVSVGYDECKTGEYYVASLDGMIIKATPLSAERPWLKSYNVGTDGVPFWDMSTGMLEADMKSGRTVLWKIPDELIDEFDLKSVRPDGYQSSSLPAQWFRKFKKRADETESEWLDNMADRAIKEYRESINGDAPDAEKLRKSFDNKTFAEKLECAVMSAYSSHHGHDDEHYSMLDFTDKAGSPGYNCIIMSILNDACWKNIYEKNSLFLINSGKSSAAAERLIGIGVMLRRGITEIKEYYPWIDIDVHVIENDDRSESEYETRTYFRDLEDGEMWVWVYRTTPGYSREDGWWHEKPVKLQTAMEKLVSGPAHI